jgi:hypothetical protein
LSSNGARAGSRNGFKATPGGVTADDPNEFCDNTPEAVNIIDFKINARLSILMIISDNTIADKFREKKPMAEAY